MARPRVVAPPKLTQERRLYEPQVSAGIATTASQKAIAYWRRRQIRCMHAFFAGTPLIWMLALLIPLIPDDAYHHMTPRLMGTNTKALWREGGSVAKGSSGRPQPSPQKDILHETFHTGPLERLLRSNTPQAPTTLFSRL